MGGNSEYHHGAIFRRSREIRFYKYQKAVEDAMEGKVDAIVTAPINKHNIQSEDFKFAGHTEYLAQQAGVQDSLMLLVDGDLRVGVVTGHIPIKEVSEKNNCGKN